MCSNCLGPCFFFFLGKRGGGLRFRVLHVVVQGLRRTSEP